MIIIYSVTLYISIGSAMAPPSLAMDPTIIHHLLHSFQSTRLATVGSATVLLYDHLITIDQEIDLFWRRDWSLLKGVFIFHRYLGLTCALIALSAILSPNVTDAVSICTFWFQWEMWGYTVVVLTSELVLLLWIFVIYNRDMRVLAMMGVLFVAETVSVIVILAKSFAQLQITSQIATGLAMNFCSLRNPPQFFFWFWLPVLIYNSAILALFIVKGTNAFRVSYDPTVWHLYRRSLVNFLAIFAVYLVCCVFWIVGDFSLGQIPAGFALAFSITSSTRLLINIRHAYYSREEADLPIIYANQGIVIVGIHVVAFIPASISSTSFGMVV
ncbi:hypothetical protein B0H13DRAFT_1965750 [Mycena leptocephala]|nr:hypothetical protein B0H13DRAFT_1965750 [Mycena leptocephala]